MRILHVVTLISPDAAYGGPVRVALNQCSALQGRGHDVVVAAAARGYDHMPTLVGDVSVRVFDARTSVPGIGCAGLRGAGMSRWIAEHASEFDVAHVHLARDFVTLPAARACIRKGIPVVAQTHGMIDQSSRVLAKPLDLFWTRPVLRAASTVFYLTPREANDLKGVVGGLETLWWLNNGVPLADPRESSSVVARPEVLFLARLHPRKRPAMFVQMAHRLIQQGYVANFALVGPDDGTQREVDALIVEYGLQSRVRYEGSLPQDRAVSRLRRASVYVLPAVDEPYPMSVLEAMSVGLPVVVTDTCGLAPLIEETRSGIVVGPDLDSLTDAVRRMLDEPTLATEMAENGRRAAVERLSMSAVADVLEGRYQRAVRGATAQR